MESESHDEDQGLPTTSGCGGLSTSTLAPSTSLSKEPSTDVPNTSRSTLFSKIDHACLNLSPSFFSINMGTGITSILLHGLPYNGRWLRIIADIIFVLNVAILILLIFGSVVRYIRFKGLWTALNTHVNAGMFWGCFPMGLATIINMIALVCVPSWGYRWAQLALGLWWIDVLISILVNFGMIFMFFTRQTHTQETISAVFLLPIVSSVVAAASGGVVAGAMASFDPILARSTIIVAYVVWGTGVPLAMYFITMWIHRTIIHGVPNANALCSVFLPLGPCGQGSFGIITLGTVVRDLAYTYNIDLAITPAHTTTTSNSINAVADAIYAGGIITGLILWGLGLCWYLIGLSIIFDHVIIKQNTRFFHHQNFSVGLWAITFPLGVFATATTALAEQLDSEAFRVIGTFLSLQVTLHWIYVGIMTLYKALDGTIFCSPELCGFPGKRPPLRWSSKNESGRDVEKAPGA